MVKKIITKNQNISKTRSVGVTLSIIIAVSLLLIIGIKSVYETSDSYNKDIKEHEALKLEQTRLLSSKMERKFVNSYKTGETFY